MRPSARSTLSRHEPPPRQRRTESDGPGVGCGYDFCGHTLCRTPSALRCRSQVGQTSGVVVCLAAAFQKSNEAPDIPHGSSQRTSEASASNICVWKFGGWNAAIPLCRPFGREHADGQVHTACIIYTPLLSALGSVNTSQSAPLPRRWCGQFLTGGRGSPLLPMSIGPIVVQTRHCSRHYSTIQVLQLLPNHTVKRKIRRQQPLLSFLDATLST